ncbi:MAG: hypothetical protein FJY07_02270 [Bacteroidetes bacterium]|nr:hypothetical protein [Bacteroidota bacterium]
MLKPVGPKQTPGKFIVADSTAAYGEYLARNVGNCRGCHIKMDNTGKQLNADFAGGGLFPPSSFSEGFAYVSPNLTPHNFSGIIANWSEMDFLNRFRKGRLHKGSPMPWGSYSRMTDNDLKALYRFFQSLDPVEFVVPKTVYTPGEELPK